MKWYSVCIDNGRSGEGGVEVVFNLNTQGVLWRRLCWSVILDLLLVVFSKGILFFGGDCVELAYQYIL